MALITGTPKRISVLGETVKMAEVAFMAIHKNLRKKKLAQVLMKEMQRRMRLNGLNQAIYSGPEANPTPFTSV